MKKNLNKIFNSKGYFVIEKAISQKTVDKIIIEIESVKEADFYLDKNKIIRRIEKLYNKGEQLLKLNQIILKYLLNIFGKEFFIFKDKYNAKPPGGNGFFPHLDGIFEFKNNDNKIKKGWYEYGDYFVNALVALDDCTKKNGTIELANQYKTNSFYELLKNTKKNGTPELNNNAIKKILFKKIILKKGDMVIFSNKCPHKSEKNNSKKNRRILYYTYLTKNFGFQYNNYFNDKENSKNETSKSLDD